jgi:pimeloyl-ACP methyl ester carboxylesterase
MAFARVNHIDLYYEVHGFGDPILLIPGLGSDANTWLPFVSAFSQTHKIIIVENRGSGRSTKFVGEITTEQMADDAVALLDELGVERAHVIGKSMGGMIAQIIAARQPHKVRSLVLASTLMRHDPYGNELLELARSMAQKSGLFACYRLAFLLSYSREYCIHHRERLMEAEALIRQMEEGPLLAGYLAQSLACQRHDSRVLASQLLAPSVVIVGAEDLITPPQASRDLAAALKNSELHILLRGGHGFWRQYPDEVNAIVRDFLARH